jgi:hypothetical protein
MILRDVYCPECGNIKEDVELESIDTDKYMAHCRRCGNFTTHKLMCNGGVNSRYRFNDFPEDPDFYKGQVKLGDTMIGDKVISRADDPKRVEALDRKHFDRRKKRGTETLTFDQKD